METIDHNRQFCFVISSFNNKSNIEKNLSSLIKQTNTNWRCIYINDCSTDNTEVLFFDLVKKYNVNPKFTYIKNDKNYGQAYSKYMAYKLVKDFEIVCILDGDDWLSDNGVLARLAKVYSDKNVQMVSSNYQEWDNERIIKITNFSTYSEDIINNKAFRKQSAWRIRHLKTGYGIFFKSIPKEYLALNGEWLKVCTDIAEYYSALELSNGKYLAIDDVMYTYNKANSLNYSTSYFRHESKDIHKTALNYIESLPPCKYTFPQTCIINMVKCTKKQEYMRKQMLFQSNTNFKFIDAIDGSCHSETDSLMKKYFSYMGLQNNSQVVTFDKSIMEAQYKNKYNFKRQHITKGSLGLIQSAFLLMSEFVKSNEDHVLILEDDVYTIKNLDKKLFINKELLKNKDLVYLGCHTSNHNIFPENSNSIFIDVLNHQHLIYGTYAMIISKKLAKHILGIGIDTILRLNVSWDLLLNYIRDTEKHQFTFFVYFKELFIPNVIKRGGINPIKDISFYTKNKIKLHDYYIPDVTNKHSENDIATVMLSHNEDFFFDFVSKVVYINLESRVDRKEHVEGQLSKYIYNNKIRRFNAVRDSRGAVGCGLSHIAVLEMAIAENWDNVFIAEDDLTWTEDFTIGYRILENLIRGDYDVIVLGGSYIKSYKDNFKLISCNCALSYIVNKSYYQQLLTCFKDAVEGLIITGNEPKFAIDQAWKVLQNRDNWYVIKPNMCMQLPSYSNIQNTFKDYTAAFNEIIEYDVSIGVPRGISTGVPRGVPRGISTGVLRGISTLNRKNFTFGAGQLVRYREPEESEFNYQSQITLNPLHIKNLLFTPTARDISQESEISIAEQLKYKHQFQNNGIFNTLKNKTFVIHEESKINTENTENIVIFSPLKSKNLVFGPRQLESEVNTSDETQFSYQYPGIDISNPVKIKNAVFSVKKEQVIDQVENNVIFNPPNLKKLVFVPTETQLARVEPPKTNNILPRVTTHNVKFSIPVTQPKPTPPKLVSFKNLMSIVKTNRS